MQQEVGDLGEEGVEDPCPLLSSFLANTVPCVVVSTAANSRQKPAAA